MAQQEATAQGAARLYLEAIRQVAFSYCVCCGGDMVLLDVPSFNSYIDDRAKIKELQAEIARLNGVIRNKTIQISHMKAELGKVKPETKKSKIIKLIEKGMKPSEIRDLGFNYHYTLEVWQGYKNAISKR